jgi:hypothetical protein
LITLFGTSAYWFLILCFFENTRKLGVFFDSFPEIHAINSV